MCRPAQSPGDSPAELRQASSQPGPRRFPERPLDVAIIADSCLQDDPLSAGRARGKVSARERRVPLTERSPVPGSWPPWPCFSGEDPGPATTRLSMRRWRGRTGLLSRGCDRQDSGPRQGWGLCERALLAGPLMRRRGRRSWPFVARLQKLARHSGTRSRNAPRTAKRRDSRPQIPGFGCVMLSSLPACHAGSARFGFPCPLRCAAPLKCIVRWRIVTAEL